MGESVAERIERLMAEGLEHYGEGRAERAAACWREVLELEPAHAAARDYLESAELDTGEIGLEETAGGEDATLLADVLRLVRRDAAAEALELVEALAARHPERMGVQGYLELLRAHLLGRYRSRLGEGRAVPRLRIPPERMLELDLPPDAGFLLSMVDGATSVDDLLALSGTDPFATLRTLHQLFDAGVLERAT